MYLRKSKSRWKRAFAGVVLSLTAMAGVACDATGSEFLLALLAAGDVDGQIELQTEDGRTVIVSIAAGENDEEQPPTGPQGIEPAEVLPPLESVEDVFRALGVWEEASELLEQGLRPSHVAEELGYTVESMEAQLLEGAKRMLNEARERGTLTGEKAEELFVAYQGLVWHWGDEIF